MTVAKVSDVLDADEQLEPTTSLPEHAGGAAPGRAAIREAAFEEATGEAAEEQPAELTEEDVNALVDELAQKDEVTADDLRQLAGAEAEGMSDEELLAAYAKAEKAEAAPELPFPVYDAQGNKIDPTKLTLEDLLSGKVQIGYQAMGKEQRKALTDLLRVASNGHYNEHKMASVLAERAHAFEQLQKLRGEHDTWAKDRQAINKALEAAINGNAEPLQRLIVAYQQALGQSPMEAPTDDAAMREAEAAGQQFFMTTIVPSAYKLAQEYGADAQEVTNAVMGLIQQEPAEFLTREKIDAILQYEVPRMLEDAGYARNGQAAPAVDPRDERIAALEKTVLELKAGTVNKATQQVRERARRAPAAGGGSVSSAGEAAPAMKSREDMKKWLRGETE